MRKSDEVVVTTRGALWRSRWAAIGAAMAVIAGIGGLGAAFASGNESATVPITPCRLLDTRPRPLNVGGRNTPLGGAQTMTLQVTGRLTNCNIPVTATGVVLNVTAVNGSAESYMTVWPAGLGRPTAANLNWRGGSGPTPNQVTAGLSAIGTLSIYNNAGTVDIVVDAAAYLTGTTPNRMTAVEIGQRNWSVDRGRPKTIPVGDQPIDAVFDGRYVWVSLGGGGGKVQMIDPATRLVVWENTSPLEPRGMTFDGTYVWVADRSRDSVWRYPVAGVLTGAPPTEFGVGSGPEEVAFDGLIVWVLNESDRTVSRLVASTGVAAPTIVFGNDSRPNGIAFDGSNMYITLRGEDRVAQVNAFTAAINFVPAGDEPTDIEYDGEFVWVVNAGSGSLTRFAPDTGAALGSAVIGAQLSGIAFDGTNLWVGAQGTQTMSRINRSSLGVDRSVALPAAPANLVWDGTSIWATLPLVDKVARVRLP